ncbi:uncharacterized protein [Thunnus thynnus]|uniref:uncharacterized protein n=1 Tax=Thunnus thynnus TaxID=8237 RepID=UPI003527621E
MAAEMEPSTTGGNWDLILQSKMKKQRLQCHVLQDGKPAVRLMTYKYDTPAHTDIHSMLRQVMSSSSRLEHKLDRCLWTQKEMTPAFPLSPPWLVLLLCLSLYLELSSDLS